MNAVCHPPLLEGNDIRLLADIGFIAAGRGDVVTADCIFKGLHAAGTTGVAHIIGPAVARLNAGIVFEALALLRVAGTSDDESIVAWRAIALQVAGMPHEARRLARTIASGQSAGARLARGLCAQRLAGANGRTQA